MQFKHQYAKESNRIKDQWRTPRSTFDPLNDVFEFTLDAAADESNALCKTYFDGYRIDGLVASWRTYHAFCNCPYTEGQYAHWIRKAADEWLEHEAKSVLLLPASLETQAYYPVWQHANYLILPYTRIGFLQPDGKRVSGAPFMSAIPVFGFDLERKQIRRLTKHVGHVFNLNRGYRSKYR